jgi:HD-GYP domain-containing protein (c-di-GMP phosphodiesterase class II)
MIPIRGRIMQKHVQTVAALAALQLACLAFGLWMQDRILLKTASWHDRRQAQGGDNAPPGTANADAASLLHVMPQVRLLTLIWTGALQLVALYLLVNRMRTDHTKSHERSQFELMRQEKDLIRTRNAVIFGLANLAESRDRETGQHLERIALYSTRLASYLRYDPRFSHRLSAAMVKSIGISSVLHDIGKVGVPDAILLKPGQLSEDERREMQQHTVIGSQCLQQIERRLGSSNFLHMARQIAMYHHERWDGTGYPYQLSGEAIPLVARIVALADMYDALSVKRVYKDAFPHAHCVEIIRSESGKHLDPGIVDVFERIESEFAEIAKQFADVNPLDGHPSVPREAVPDQPMKAGETPPNDNVLDFEKTIEKALVGVPNFTAV